MVFQIGDFGGAGVYGHLVGGPLQGLMGKDPKGVHPVVEPDHGSPQQQNRSQKTIPPSTQGSL